MNKSLAIIALSLILAVSCKDQESNDRDMNSDQIENADTSKENNSAQDTNDSYELTNYDDESQDWKPSRAYSRDEANRMADDITYNVRVNDDTISEIRGYSDYSDMRNYLDVFAASSPETEMESELTLREGFDVFKNTIPYYLRRTDVNGAIRDVEKELTDYEQHRAKKNPSEQEHRENIDEIQMAFDNLEKEIIQARKKFEDNREDAMEEFMEEIKDKSSKTQSERYRDAMEEYREELEN